MDVGRRDEGEGRREGGDMEERGMRDERVGRKEGGGRREGKWWRNCEGRREE